MKAFFKKLLNDALFTAPILLFLQFMFPISLMGCSGDASSVEPKPNPYVNPWVIETGFFDKEKLDWVMIEKDYMADRGGLNLDGGFYYYYRRLVDNSQVNIISTEGLTLKVYQEMGTEVNPNEIK